MRLTILFALLAAALLSGCGAAPATPVEPSPELGAFQYFWPAEPPAGWRVRPAESSADVDSFTLTFEDPANPRAFLVLAGGPHSLAAERPAALGEGLATMVRGRPALAVTTGSGRSFFWAEDGHPYALAGQFTETTPPAWVSRLDALDQATWEKRLQELHWAAEPTAQPVIAPTAQPPAVPTARPATGVLPAPLYALEEGQVVRIDVDGITKTTLTDEQPFVPDALAVVALAVSPADGALAYVAQGQPGGMLVVTDADGGNRRVLLENVPVSSPRWSPDGSALSVQIAPPDDASLWRDGLYVVSAVSGEARLLVANDPLPPDGAADARGYAPDAWSPDGRKILVSRYSQSAEVCDAAILDVATGALVVLEASADDIPALHVECGSGVWSPDSATVYVALRQSAMSPREPGLYTVDAASGQMGWVVPAQTNDGTFALVQSFGVSPDGELYALVARADQPLDPAAPGVLAPPAALYRVLQEDRMLEQIREEAFALYGIPVWAPDGSGVVIPTPRTDGGVAYFFVPVSGEAVRLPIEPTDTVRWGR